MCELVAHASPAWTQKYIASAFPPLWLVHPKSFPLPLMHQRFIPILSWVDCMLRLRM